MNKLELNKDKSDIMQLRRKSAKHKYVQNGKELIYGWVGMTLHCLELEKKTLVIIPLRIL